MTRPELRRRWYGPRGYHLVVREIDLRVGGSWRFVVRAPDGSDMVMHGVQLDVDRPARLCNTEANDDCEAEAGTESWVTTVLVEKPGVTTLTSTTVYPSRRIRDDVLHSGIEHGRAEGCDRPADMLAPIETKVTA